MITKATAALTNTPPQNTDRYHAWTCCHDEFYKYRLHRPTNQADIDLLCLHLHCYLGNWGMFRNSKLVQHNFLIHRDVIDIIYDPKYKILWNADAKTIQANRRHIMQLIGEIKNYYNSMGISATDTLVSKVILGTICCIPAFDTKVRNTLNGLDISQTISSNSISNICNIYLKNKNLFDKFWNNTYMRNVPFAKMIDFCLWQ